MMELPAEVEVIDGRRRYVLGALGDQFGVWDRRQPEHAIELFPGTDEGYGGAERLFEELRALDVAARGTVSRALRWGVFAGAALWLASGLIQATIALLPGSPEADSAVRVLYAIDVVGYRVALGALVALAAMALLRSERAAWLRTSSIAPRGDDSTPRPERHPRPSTVVALVWVLAVALLLWTVAGALSRSLFRFQLEPFLSGGVQHPGVGVVVVNVMEATSFRVALAALVGLLVMWAWPRGGPAAIGPEPTSQGGR